MDKWIENDKNLIKFNNLKYNKLCLDKKLNVKTTLKIHQIMLKIGL